MFKLAPYTEEDRQTLAGVMRELWSIRKEMTDDPGCCDGPHYLLANEWRISDLAHWIYCFKHRIVPTQVSIPFSDFFPDGATIPAILPEHVVFLMIARRIEDAKAGLQPPRGTIEALFGVNLPKVEAGETDWRAVYAVTSLEVTKKDIVHLEEFEIRVDEDRIGLYETRPEERVSLLGLIRTRLAAARARAGITVQTQIERLLFDRRAHQQLIHRIRLRLPNREASRKKQIASLEAKVNAITATLHVMKAVGIGGAR